jgi:hypothetical protein
LRQDGQGYHQKHRKQQREQLQGTLHKFNFSQDKVRALDCRRILDEGTTQFEEG